LRVRRDVVSTFFLCSTTTIIFSIRSLHLLRSARAAFCRAMNGMAASSPSYGLNTALSQGTVEPPVPMARAWAESYPSKFSPLRCNGDDASSSKVRLPLLNLAQGVPGHPPHPALVDAMCRESKINIMATHGYGPVFGEPSLRDQLAKDLSKRYKASIKNTEIAITSGCNLAAGVTFHALACPGEAVVLPTPWYFK
jgi:DNA-binding transcriptional MocR family regulator